MRKRKKGDVAKNTRKDHYPVADNTRIINKGTSRKSIVESCKEIENNLVPSRFMKFLNDLLFGQLVVTRFKRKTEHTICV